MSSVGREGVRIGDAEREAAVATLGEHYAMGRLTKDEYDERAGVAWAARTNADLTPLFRDLPSAPATPAAGADRSRMVVRPPARRSWHPPLLPLLALAGGLALLLKVPILVPVLLVLALWMFSGGFRGRCR